MYIRHFLTSVLCAAAISAFAIPAKHGVTRSITQPDGSTLLVSPVGDEFHHYYLTSDRKIVISSDDSFFYASTDADGRLLNTGILAHEPAERSAQENALLESVSFDKVHSAIMSNTSDRQRISPHAGTGKDASSRYPTVGQVKALVFLVEYADVTFTTENAGEYFHNMINQEGFSESNGTGSCRDYYVQNSNGQFLPDFDVYGPVTLPYQRSYYGGNDASGNDRRPQYMMLHAAQALNDEVDFSQYDTDGDGYVDNVYIFYAGEGEAAGGSSDCIWPHSWEYTFGQYFDGVKFRKYACGPEMISATSIDGIGTFCHEFGHVMGLPDLYNTDNAYADYTPSTWSVMDQGCYNNNSRTPPAFSSYERNALGWMDETLYDITDAASCTLENLADSNRAYVISTENPNEFFLFENRQKEGWDKYLPYHGMLVWHIDYVQSKWRNNIVNNDGSHQYVDLIEACGRPYSSLLNQRRYPFPGTTKVTEFVFGGSPSFESWGGISTGFDITNIKEVDGVITFDVNGGGPDPAAGIADVKLGSTTCYVSGREISVSTQGHITICDMMGRVIATGNDDLTVSNAPKGIYIVNTTDGCSKLMVR